MNQMLIIQIQAKLKNGIFVQEKLCLMQSVDKLLMFMESNMNI